MDPSTTQVAIGIDVGGTAVKAGLVADGGRVLHKESIATPTDEGVDAFIARLADLVKHFQHLAESKSATIAGVGLGMPGTLDHVRGVVIAPPNLPGWRDVPIVDRLKAATGLRIALDNDANNAALGEYMFGAGRGVRDMVMLTLGTGIGGGMILNGKLWRGALGNAGEWGHMIIHVNGRRCGCGQFGCLEAHASATATVKRVMEALGSGKASILSEIIAKGGTIEAEDVARAAADGDAVAVGSWEKTCRYLAIACLNIHHALNPQRIVLAGGMSAAEETLLRPVRDEVAQRASMMLGAPPDIRLAKLGNDAGFIGSAVSIFQT